MHLRFFIPAIAFLAACESGPEKPLQWTTYTSAAAGFEISIPVPYSTYDDVSEHAFGEHREYSVYWRKPEWSLSRLGLKLLSAGYYEIPGLQGRDAAYVLDSFVRMEARMSGVDDGRVLGLDAAPVQGRPARQLRIMIDNGKADSLYLCEEFILSGARVYHLRTNGYKKYLDTAAMRYFLESFRLH